MHYQKSTEDQSSGLEEDKKSSDEKENEQEAETETQAPKTEKNLIGENPDELEMEERMPHLKGNIDNLEDDILSGNMSMEDRQLLN